MDNETSYKENNEKNDGYSWIGRVVRSQPEVIQKAYREAISASIKETYLPFKSGLPPETYIKDARKKFMEVYNLEVANYESKGLIPEGFDRSFFEISLKSWVSFMNESQLVHASIDHSENKSRMKENISFEWQPDNNFLKHLAKALHDSDSTTQKAFFLGNKKAKLFLPHEVEEIIREMERLGSK